MLFFVDLSNTSEFMRNFKSSELPVKDFLMWVGKASLPAAENVMNKIEKSVGSEVWAAKI